MTKLLLIGSARIDFRPLSASSHTAMGELTRLVKESDRPSVVVRLLLPVPVVLVELHHDDNRPSLHRVN